MKPTEKARLAHETLDSMLDEIPQQYHVDVLAEKPASALASGERPTLKAQAGVRTAVARLLVA